MLEAGLWGLLGGLALVLGAVAGTVRDVPTQVIGGVMAFGFVLAFLQSQA